MLANIFNKNTIRKIKVLLVIIFTVALASLILTNIGRYLRMSEGFTNGELSTTKDAYLSSITQNTKDATDGTYPDLDTTTSGSGTLATVDVIITNGGTGLTGRDSTPEAILSLSNKVIDGFGELFRQISFNKIGTSTIQSRAVAGLINHTYVFALPGSPSACKDGWDEILKFQLDIRHQPCNFIELIPRLNEI